MMIVEPPPITRSSFVEIAMDKMSSVCSMTDPICSCVAVSQNDIDELAQAAMNVPLLASAMHIAFMLL